MAPAYTTPKSLDRPAPSTRHYYTAAEVARDFVGISPSTFHRKEVRDRLYRQQPNPLPRPYCERPLRWDAVRLNGWKRCELGLPAASLTNDNDVLDPMDAARLALRRAYAAEPV